MNERNVNCVKLNGKVQLRDEMLNIQARGKKVSNKTFLIIQDNNESIAEVGENSDLAGKKDSFLFFFLGKKKAPMIENVNGCLIPRK